jgi:alpha-L-arabinofuranosidase
MATVMKTAPRELHGYISEVSERADVQAGVNFAIFSRDASRVRLECIRQTNPSFTSVKLMMK